MNIETITIIMRDANDFDIHHGGRYANRLCWDEMLGCIAKLTLKHPVPPYMQSTDANLARFISHNDRMRDLRAERQAEFSQALGRFGSRAELGRIARDVDSNPRERALAVLLLANGGPK